MEGRICGIPGSKLGGQLSLASDLFYAIVDHSGPEVEVVSAWDPVERMLQLQEKGAYFYDPETLEERGYDTIHYSAPDSSQFRTDWKYMPQFTILDQTELVKTMAVFLMLFVFIALVCFAAFLVISFTRCMTIAMANAQVYEDLRHFRCAPRLPVPLREGTGEPGVPNAHPRGDGVGLRILYPDDVRQRRPRRDQCPRGGGDAGVLLAVVGVVSVLLYLVYRLTLRKVCAVTIDRPRA